LDFLWRMELVTFSIKNKMKFIIQLLLLLIGSNCFAQKDKTLSWDKAQHYLVNHLEVSFTSHPFKNTFYEEYKIIPNYAKTFHISIDGSLKSSDYKENITYTLQIFSQKKLLFNENINGHKAINIKLINTEPLTLKFIASPPENDVCSFSFFYAIGDTTELNYDSNKPKFVFEELLKLASTGFINITRDRESKNEIYPFISYGSGLFFALPATKQHDRVVQPIADGILNETDADDLFTAWNTKIQEWLKDYNVTDIKTFKNGQSLYPYYTYTNDSDKDIVYSKSNINEENLFEVVISKKRYGRGRVDKPYKYAVYISIK